MIETFVDPIIIAALVFAIGFIVGYATGRTSITQFETRAEIMPIDNGAFSILTYCVPITRDNDGTKRKPSPDAHVDFGKTT